MAADDEAPPPPVTRQPFDENRPIRAAQPLPFDERPIGGACSNQCWDEADQAGAPAAEQWKLAALNYNTSRTFGAAYNEDTDGKLGSVYTALTEKLIARGDWKRCGRSPASGPAHGLPPNSAPMLQLRVMRTF